MLSRRTDSKDDHEGYIKPLLRLAMLETYELVWNDMRIFEPIKLASLKDSTLEPVLSFFSHGPEQAPVDIRRRFQAYHLTDGILYF